MQSTYLREIDVVYRRTAVVRPLVMSPAEVVRVFNELQDSTREKFLAICLDTKNGILCFDVVAIGTVDAALIHVREAFRACFICNAPAVIFLHNHPSGNYSPSGEDLKMFKRLHEAGELLNIKVLDCLIIGAGGFYSAKDAQVF